MPPATVKRQSSSIMNWKYSITAPTTAPGSPPAIIQVATGRPRMSATISWLRGLSQKPAVAGISGKSAMLSSIRTKGISPHAGIVTSHILWFGGLSVTT